MRYLSSDKSSSWPSFIHITWMFGSETSHSKMAFFFSVIFMSLIFLVNSITRAEKKSKSCSDHSFKAHGQKLSKKLLHRLNLRWSSHLTTEQFTFLIISEVTKWEKTSGDLFFMSDLKWTTKQGLPKQPLLLLLLKLLKSKKSPIETEFRILHHLQIILYQFLYQRILLKKAV